MSARRWWLVLALLAVVPLELKSQGPAPRVVWVYSGKDARTDSEKRWAGGGYMPAERVRQIATNATCPVDPADARKGTCLEYLFRFREAEDWVGVYHLLQNGSAWGSVRGPDLARELKLRPADRVVLKFRARGSGTVSLKCGGVETGAHPSSMLPAREVAGSPIALTDQFRDYAIGPFPASEIRNCVDPFCVVASAMDNPGRKIVRVFVTEIRFEPHGR